MSDYKRLNTLAGWLFRVLNPGVTWWVAVLCDAVALIAFVLLFLDPDGYLRLALAMLIPAIFVLYGFAAVRWWRRHS
jgi:hypothetical protein